jgi:hypothetical protein
MRGRRRFFLIPVMILVFIFVGGWVVQHLWNWLLPAVFGWRMITFWQAVGLLALCRILFGRFGGPRPFGRSKFGHRMAERWMQMTPEEHEKFREGMRGRCGHFGAPAAESKGQ